MNKPEVLMDKDLLAVADFMQANMAAVKLVSIAEAMPTLAKLLWGHNPQEPIRPIAIEITCLGRADVQRQAASECALGRPRVGDDSVVEEASR